MRLPSADRAVIDSSKVRDYLLSQAHPVGRFKAAFFRALGYSDAAWESLAEDLRRHALQHEAILTISTPYGHKYEVRGRLRGPQGRTVVLVTVWIVLNGEDFPRLVTAFPGSRG